MGHGEEGRCGEGKISETKPPSSASLLLQKPIGLPPRWPFQAPEFEVVNRSHRGIAGFVKECLVPASDTDLCWRDSWRIQVLFEVPEVGRAKVIPANLSPLCIDRTNEAMRGHECPIVRVSTKRNDGVLPGVKGSLSGYHFMNSVQNGPFPMLLVHGRFADHLEAAFFDELGFGEAHALAELRLYWSMVLGNRGENGKSIKGKVP